MICFFLQEGRASKGKGDREKEGKGLSGYEMIPHHFPAPILIRLPKSQNTREKKEFLNKRLQKAWAYFLECYRNNRCLQRQSPQGSRLLRMFIHGSRGRLPWVVKSLGQVQPAFSHTGTFTSLWSCFLTPFASLRTLVSHHSAKMSGVNFCQLFEEKKQKQR